MRCSINDISAVDYVLKHPEVYPWISDDGSPSAEEFTSSTMISNPEVFVLMPSDGVVFILHPWNSITLEVHTNIVPERRGREAISETMKAMSWIFENTGCLKIVTHVPSFNRQAKLFALKCKMKQEGVNRQSFLKDGILYDQDILGITRKEWSCLPPL